MSNLPFEKLVTVTVTLPAFKIRNLFIPRTYLRDTQCIVCGWKACITVGDLAVEEPNPEPHMCVIGKALEGTGCERG